SSTSYGKGLNWLQQMIDVCNGQCSYGYINLNHYSTSFAEFKTHVQEANTRFPNKQIVVVEFARQNPVDRQADQVVFFKQAFPFLDSASYVGMYSPFVASSSASFSANDAAGSAFVGTSSTLYNNDGSVSAGG
ncbi:glycosyl hydrolase catalytic core-domain-containing protein, partial [Mycena epipterygia]